MRRTTQNMLLVLLGGALLKITLSGTYLRYVKPAQFWPLVIAGVITLGLATVSIARELNGRHADEAGHGKHDEHDEHQHGARGAWLLVLPVFAVFLIGPPALGADTVERVGSVPVQPSGDGSALFPPLEAGKVLRLPVSGFVERAAWDKARSLDHRTVRLTGFVVHERGTVSVARIVIYCCAADAYPAKVHLVGADLSRYADNTWIEAVVELEPGSATEKSAYIPTATVRSIRPVSQPKDPYEH
jgi:uncharacterized repeat protein (TIGR03943 family)